MWEGEVSDVGRGSGMGIGKSFGDLGGFSNLTIHIILKSSTQCRSVYKKCFTIPQVGFC